MACSAKIAHIGAILALVLVAACGQYGSPYDPITGVNSCYGEPLTNQPNDYRGDIRCGPQTQPVSG